MSTRENGEQERLGHSSVAITLDLYTHRADDQHADAAAKDAALLVTNP